MDINSLALYIHELRNQTLYMETSIQLFNQALEGRSSTGAFFAAQSALTSASNIANLLWPPRARARVRGEKLREVLQLPEDHALNDRRLLNLWDHGDQRTEDWIQNTKGEKVVMDYVGPKASLADSDMSDENIYRLYDPQTNLFYFRGQVFHFQGIAAAAADVGSRVIAIHKQLLPDQQPADVPEGDLALTESTAQPESNPAPENATAPTSESEAEKPAVEKAAKKPATKKPAAKKAPAKKKAATKKPPATKKSTAKKTPAKKPTKA